MGPKTGVRVVLVKLFVVVVMCVFVGVSVVIR